MSNQISNPKLPFMGKLPSEMQPGNRIRIRGVISRPNGDCRLHLQSGSSLDPSEDIALSMNILPSTREILRNSFCSGQWGQEERVSDSPIKFEEEFDLSIEADSKGFDIGVDGRTLKSFTHRCSVQIVRYIFITGGCVIRGVLFENWNSPLQVISVTPSAPVLTADPAPTPSAPIPFQIPSWPHGNFQHFVLPSPPPQPLPPPTMYHQPQHPTYNPAMFFQQPFQMSIPNFVQKSESGSNLQYQILITVLWKICCILFKTLKYIVVALVSGFGVYLISKRLRL